ncbi:MAG: hypothetical protein ABFS46_05615 [Myxococcota bacterium]
MAPEEVLVRLVELAREGGLQVREVAGSPGDDLPVRSAIGRLRDGFYVVLVGSEPLEDRIELVARAIRQHCPGASEGRYLPPALRMRLDEPG